MTSTFGRLFRVTTFGESHGGAVGAVVDGCPPGIPLAVETVQKQLDRRRPGQSKLTTARAEPDRVEILSGVFEGKTLGTPIALVVHNKDARSGDYEPFKDVYRPSHADYTYDAKYGVRNWKGGGRSSARETIGRVAAGAVAGEALKALAPGCETVAWVQSVGEIVLSPENPLYPRFLSEADVDANDVRCPHGPTAEKMAALIKEVKAAGDSVGGVIRCAARGVPAGLGEPVFEKLEADLARAMMSIPATKGFEIGSGFASARMLGSEHNDPFRMEDGRVRTTTNRSGGVQGGISNGELIDLRVAFKPPATIFIEQETVTASGEPTKLVPRGRHDPCVLPRAVPIVEAMVRLVLIDHLLRQRAIRGDDWAPAKPSAENSGNSQG